METWPLSCAVMVAYDTAAYVDDDNDDDDVVLSEAHDHGIKIQIEM